MGNARCIGLDSMVDYISRIGVSVVAPAVAIRHEEARPAGNR